MEREVGKVEHRIEQPPLAVHLVGVHEQRLVALHHVEQQRLVRLGQRLNFCV